MKNLLGRSVIAAAVGLCACSSGGGGGQTAAAPKVTLSATPSIVTPGQSFNLQWSSTNASTCSAAGSWSGSTALSGQQEVILQNPGIYVFALNCSGPGGSDAATAHVQVNTSGGGGGGAQFPVSLSAEPTAVAVGESTTLTWLAQDAESCSASGGWSGTKSPSGSQSVSITAPGYTYFQLDCTGPTGTGSSYVYVQGLVATVSISASAATVGAGQPVTLTWSTTYASGCTASGAWTGAKAASGTEEVTPASTGDHAYTLTCSDPGAPATASATVTAALPVVTLLAFPAEPIVGDSVTLTWEASYALGCEALQGWSGARANEGRETLAVTEVGTRQYTLVCSNAGGSDEITLPVTAAAPPAEPRATGFQMNARHDGHAEFVGGITLPLVSTPAWTRDLGAEVSYPLIADGLVFVATENTNGSYGNRLFALDPATGAMVWGPVALSGTYFWQGLAYDGGRIFTLNFDGLVRAFNATTGAALWSRQLGGYWYHAAPVAYGGFLFATGNGGTYALDQATGAIKWTHSVNGDEASPAVTSAGLYLAGNCGVLALNPATGRELWSSESCGNYAADLSTRNGKVYARHFDGNAFLWDAATGEERGTLSSQRAIALSDDYALTLYSATLAATDTTTGIQQWSFAGDGGLVSTPIVMNNTVFVASSSGKVYAVDAASGSQLWFGTAPPINAPDQWNINTLTGLAAGEGLLVVPAGNTVAAWRLN